MPDQNQNKDAKQDIKQAEMQKDICFLKDEVAAIKKAVYNHLPTEIKKIGTDLQNFKLSNAKWLVGILTTLILTLAAAIINLII